MSIKHEFNVESVELPPEAGDIDARCFDPDDDWIKGATEDLQISAMRKWFCDRYEDPANQTPYSSDEGGYLYIWGGPYDPGNEIQERFDRVVPHEVMQRLIIELLQEVGSEWAPIEPDIDDYQGEFGYVIAWRGDPLRLLQERLAQVDAVLDVQGNINTINLVCQMAHSSLIAALEAYLAETTTYWLKQDHDTFRHFVTSNKDFQDRKLTLTEIFDRYDNLHKEVNEYLQDLIWHRLDKIKPMMQSGLGIAIPSIGELMKEVIIRHDIVHRAGRTKTGEVVLLTVDHVRRVSRSVMAFAGAIEGEIMRRFHDANHNLFL